MADSFVQLATDGSGKKVDTRTEATNSEHRQVFVVGDPSLNAGVAPVDGTKGLAVDLTNSGANANKFLVTPDLPSGASTAAKQPALGTAGTSSADVLTVQGRAAMTPLLVDPSAVTSPVSAASLPLPSGAATAAKQPALGTAGTASADVLTVQGKAAMTPLLVDPSGVTSPVSLASVPSHPVTNAGTFAVQAAGDVASGSGDSGNPVKLGGVGKTANPTAVTDGQRVNGLFDKLGKQVVVGSVRDLKTQAQTTITSSTTETTVLAAVASTFLDVYGVIVTNTSATGSKVVFKDSTGGTTRFVIEVPAGDTRGFMLPESAAITQAAVNTNWTATCGTSVASMEITVLAVKNI